MASSAAAFSANICSTNMRIRFFNKKQQKQNLNFFKIRASSEEQQDCNVEECAPDKEVGKVSVEWLAGEKTKVSGTFPPRRRDWSGYVEKDTAGQTNIYSVEPAVYVAESAISSGNSGTSADGSENTAALVAFGGLIALAAASTILLQVGKNPPPIQTLDYKGPSLTYYITKFKPSPTSIPSPETPQIDSPDVTSASPESPQIASPDATSASPESPQIDSADVASASAENLQTSQVPQIGSADVTSASAENLQASEVLQIDSADVKSTSQVQEIDPSTSPALQVDVGSD